MKVILSGIMLEDIMTSSNANPANPWMIKKIGSALSQLWYVQHAIGNAVATENKDMKKKSRLRIRLSIF